MKRHLSWIVPFVGVFALYLGAALGTNINLQSGSSVNVQALIQLAIFLMWVVLTIVLVIRTVRNGYRVFRGYRRSGGHLTKSEQAQANLQQNYENSWAAARNLVAQLSAGHRPASLEVWGIVLEPGETVHLSIRADYARFYGLNGTYVHTSGFFWGQPAFVLAGFGVTALANRSRRRAAQAASRQQWRDSQHSQMFLTDRRIICQANGRWLSFYYAHVSVCYPEPENNSMVLEFHSSEPLLIGGAEAPVAIAYLVWALYGEHGLKAHPALESLRR
ncbi:hypothetical protein [Arthrobacter sp. G119Y2]|uniref:hypothetical protein n=1 Tax=Arthrobacter sp. G119Y2 TaxID=3134965 RepID=UPI00311A3537